MLVYDPHVTRAVQYPVESFEREGESIFTQSAGQSARRSEDSAPGLCALPVSSSPHHDAARGERPRNLNFAVTLAVCIGLNAHGRHHAGSLTTHARAHDRLHLHGSTAASSALSSSSSDTVALAWFDWAPAVNGARSERAPEAPAEPPDAWNRVSLLLFCCQQSPLSQSSASANTVRCVVRVRPVASFCIGFYCCRRVPWRKRRLLRSLRARIPSLQSIDLGHETRGAMVVASVWSVRS